MLGAGAKHKAIRTLQKSQVSRKEAVQPVDDLKEVRPTQVGLDEGVLEELLKLGLDSEEKLESFFIADDPEIRKAARRIKIERRLQQAQRTPEEEGLEKARTTAEIQMEDSLIRILELLEDTRRSISSVQTTSIKDQLERQTKERKRREEIDAWIKEECENAKIEFEILQDRWKRTSEIDDLQLLHFEAAAAKTAGVELLKQKDGTIANLENKIKQADRLFNDELSKQEDYLSMMNERINDQICVMNDCYRRELQNLQNVVNIEKNEILNERKKQWEKTAGMKEKLELENTVKRFDHLQEYEEQIDSMMIEQHETMKDQKMIMENKLNKLMVEENRYQSAVSISKELLNYNVQVLQKRQDENRVIKGQQKRIVNRLQDSVRKLFQEQKKEIQRLINEKKQLQEGIKKVHANVNTLNVRLKNLAASSNKKYFQLWDYNQSVAEDLIDKLVKADKKFHVSLLCVSWHIPAAEFSRKNLPSYLEAKGILKELKGNSQNNHFWPDIEKKEMQKLFSLVLDSIENKTEYLIDDTLKVFLEPLSPTSRTLITINSLFDALGMRDKDDIEYMSKFFLPYVVCQQCEKADKDEDVSTEIQENEQHVQPSPEIVSSRIKKQFAVTNQVIKEEFCARGAILNLVTGDDELVIRENDPKDETLLRRHEISGYDPDQSELPILAVKSPSKLCDPDDEDQPEQVAGKLMRLDTLMCDKEGHNPVINAIHVSKALNDFVTKLNEERKSKELVSLKEILTQKTITESRLMTKDDINNFWTGFGKVLSDKKKLMWRSLLTQMKVHYKTLLRRHQINEAIKKAKRRHAELRRLLSNYVSAQPNVQEVAERFRNRLPFLYEDSEDSLSIPDE